MSGEKKVAIISDAASTGNNVFSGIYVFLRKWPLKFKEAIFTFFQNSTQLD